MLMSLCYKPRPFNHNYFIERRKRNRNEFCHGDKYGYLLRPDHYGIVFAIGA